MRYSEIIAEEAVVDDDLMGFWELAAHYGVDDAASNMHDASLPWINRNMASCVTRMAKNKKMRLASKIKLFWNLNGPSNYGTKFASPEMFEEALSQPVTMWRGGGGVYDPDYAYPNPWASFTIKEKRVETFSKYNGTYAMRAYRLPERDQYWVVKLVLPLKDILLYLPHGNDEEVIISSDDARRAELVLQTEKA